MAKAKWKTVLIAPATHRKLKLAAAQEGRQINGEQGLADAVLSLYLDQRGAVVLSCEGTNVGNGRKRDVPTSAV